MSRGATPPPSPNPQTPLGICQVLCSHGGASRFKVTSFHGQIIPSYSRSFHSFNVKLYVKCAFLASLLKELGIHMSNTLVSACALKTCEKF